jgi:hypothetical protein
MGVGVSNFTDSNFTENIVSGPKAQGGGVWSGCRDLQLQGVLLKGNEAQAESEGDAAGGAMFISSSGSSSRTTARLWKVDITDNFARMITTVPKIRLALSANAGGLFVDAGVQAKLDDCTLRHNAAGGVGLYEERWSNAKQNYFREAVTNRESSAAHIYTKGNTTLSNCTITDEKGLGIILGENAAWWWIVVGDGALLLLRSVFSASAGYLFDHCPYHGNNACDQSCTDRYGMGASDYFDCRSAAPPRGAGKLLNVASTSAVVILRDCTVKNLTVDSTSDTKIGIVNSIFEPAQTESSQIGPGQLSNSSVRLVMPPDCSALGLCNTDAMCIANVNSLGVACRCADPFRAHPVGAKNDGSSCRHRCPGVDEEFRNQECKPCKPGFARALDQTPNGIAFKPTSCVACSPGFFKSNESTRNESTRNISPRPANVFSSCVPCDVLGDGNAYQDSNASTTCKACPEGTVRRVGSAGTTVEDCQCVRLVDAFPGM